MRSIPSGKGLPSAIVAPFGNLIIRPAAIRTTPTIRRSIAAATKTLPELIAAGRNGSFQYVVRDDVYPTDGCCVANFWNDSILTADIGLDHRAIYSFDNDDGAIIKVQGARLPGTSHGGRGYPVASLIRHPLLAAIDPEFDAEEMISDTDEFDDSDADDPDAWGLLIEIDTKLVPLYPDIYPG